VKREAASVAERVRELAPETCVASGGTARALAKILGPAARVEGRPIHRDELRSLARELLHADARRLAALGVDPARRDAIGVGATVLSAVIDALGAPSLRISPGGLREGILLEKFRSLDHPTRPKSARVSAGRERDLSL
jgi:exopolyphosphatase/pppGpp-phosphohydrolase